MGEQRHARRVAVACLAPLIVGLSLQTTSAGESFNTWINNVDTSLRETKRAEQEQCSEEQPGGNMKEKELHCIACFYVAKAIRLHLEKDEEPNPEDMTDEEAMAMAGRRGRRKMMHGRSELKISSFLESVCDDPRHIPANLGVLKARCHLLMGHFADQLGDLIYEKGTERVEQWLCGEMERSCPMTKYGFKVNLF